MKTIASLPVVEVEFDKNGKLFNAAQLAELQGLVKDQAVTDLIVFAHGWNNDIADARDLYTRFFTEVGNAVTKGDIPALAGRKFAAAVTLWPSKKFTDSELIPGGGAASLSKDEIKVVKARLNDFTKDFVRLGKAQPASAATKKKVERAKALLPKLETDEKAQEQFVKIVRSLLSEKSAEKDDGTKEFFKTKDAQVLQNLRKEAVVVAPAGRGGAAGLGTLNGGGPGTLGNGGSAGLFSDLGDSIMSGARRLLNFTTYYQMKERAGTVGVNGVAPMLATLRKAAPKLKIHLAGHSFGGRLVTATTSVTTASNRPDTLTLLQAAYSHNGLASKFDGKTDGFFRKIMTGAKVNGPILITHTKNDKAVGIAYPLASRINGVKTAALGDENDPYGGIGRNGAQKTPEAVVGELLATGGAYTFSAGKCFNLKADAFIGDHSDICKPQVAWALLTGIATT